MNMVGQNGLHVKRTYERTCAQVDARVSTQVDAQVSQYCASGCKSGRIHMCIFTCGPKVDLKNEQVKMHMWMRPLLHPLAQYWLTCASTCALICASTCGSTCALRISYLRATPGVFLKSLFTTFWNQLKYLIGCVFVRIIFWPGPFVPWNPSSASDNAARARPLATLRTKTLDREAGNYQPLVALLATKNLIAPMIEVSRCVTKAVNVDTKWHLSSYYVSLFECAIYIRHFFGLIDNHPHPHLTQLHSIDQTKKSKKKTTPFVNGSRSPRLLAFTPAFSRTFFTMLMGVSVSAWHFANKRCSECREPKISTNAMVHVTENGSKCVKLCRIVCYLFCWICVDFSPHVHTCLPRLLDMFWIHPPSQRSPGLLHV